MVSVSKVIAAALAGGTLMTIVNEFFIGLSIALPGGSVCYCLCCLWLMGGGALSACMLKRFSGVVELKYGALVGALSGLAFALLTTVFIAVLMFFSFSVPAVPMQEVFSLPGVYLGPGFRMAGLLVHATIIFITHLIWGLIFCTIGGVIAAKLLEKR